MQDVLHYFLCRYVDPSKSFLLALSGGPDSLFLLHLLAEYKGAFSFAVAHVDHGWRKESADEAEKLRALAGKLEVPFHLKALDPMNMQGNLEAACRKERLKFFKQLCQEHGYQAVMLGHHADDQAETIFKKVLEGVSMPYLSGLQEEGTFDGLKLWRPLLKIKKKQITSWLKSQSIEAFDDETNRDVRFLRARFRQRIFPLLNEEFGKEISLALCDLGNESSQLNSYLYEKIAPFLSAFYEGPLGISLDLTKGMPQADLELRFLIRHFFKMCNMSVSSKILDTAHTLIRSSAANKSICHGNSTVYIDRGRLFFLKAKVSWDSKVPIKAGKLDVGLWSLEVLALDSCEALLASSWQDAWQGTCCVLLPYSEYYFLSPCVSNRSYPRASPIAKLWNAFKVPAFLYSSLPIVCCGDNIIHEFLTGRQHTVFSKHQKVLKLLLKVNI